MAYRNKLISPAAQPLKEIKEASNKSGGKSSIELLKNTAATLSGAVGPGGVPSCKS